MMMQDSTNLLKPELQLRPYQEEVKAEIYEEISAGHNRIVLTAGTGAGKTEIACAIAQDYTGHGYQVWFLVDRDNLVRQTKARFAKYGVEVGVVKSGFPEDLSIPVQVASVQTLARRPKAQKWLMDPSTRSIVMWDEAHKTAFSTLGKKLIGAKAQHHVHIGLTATPRRLARSEGFYGLFDAQVIAPVPSWLMEQGYLVRPRYYGLPEIDTRGLKTVAGDWSLGDLGRVVDDPQVVKDAVFNWQKLGDNRPTIGFTVNVSHALAMEKAFNEAGISARAVHGEMDPVTEREPIYAALAAGEIKAVFSCEALAEGFDSPIVGCVMLCRPTQSWAKYLQQLGRGLRTYPGKSDCIILDQSGNVSRFGFVEDLTKFDFRMDAPGQKGEGGAAPTKICKICNAIVHASLKECPECGAPFPKTYKELATGLMVDLKAAKLAPTPPKLDQWDERAQYYREMRKEAFTKRISPGYAAVKFAERYGENERPKVRAWSKGACCGPYPRNSDKAKYLKYLESVASRKGKSKAWVSAEYSREFGETPAQMSLFDF